MVVYCVQLTLAKAEESYGAVKGDTRASVKEGGGNLAAFMFLFKVQLSHLG